MKNTSQFRLVPKESEGYFYKNIFFHQDILMNKKLLTPSKFWYFLNQKDEMKKAKDVKEEERRKRNESW